jgi:hypothetical protein
MGYQRRSKVYILFSLAGKTFSISLGYQNPSHEMGHYFMFQSISSIHKVSERNNANLLVFHSDESTQRGFLCSCLL